MPIPRAAIAAALGFHDTAGIPFKVAISTVGEIGRVFIISKEKDRFAQVERKFQINGELVKGKEVLLIDSLLVRGSTAMVLIPKLREAGATKIHMRLTAPPPRFPCHMGMAMAKPGNCWRQPDDEQLRKIIGGTLRYMTIEELKELMGTQFCDACFTESIPFRCEKVREMITGNGNHGLQGDRKKRGREFHLPLLIFVTLAASGLAPDFSFAR